MGDYAPGAKQRLRKQKRFTAEEALNPTKPPCRCLALLEARIAEVQKLYGGKDDLTDYEATFIEGALEALGLVQKELEALK